MWYLRGTFIADPMLRNRRWWVLLVVWGEPLIGILWDGFPNPRHPFIQAFISGSWLWLLPFILAFVIASVFFERLKLSHSNFHNSFQKRIGPKTPNHWLFLFYWKKSWKKHTFALLKSPHTVPCFLIGFCQILDGWASHWAIHLFKCWTSCFTNKTSFLWGFYGVFFPETMIQLQKTDDSCVCDKMVVEYCPCMSMLYGPSLYISGGSWHDSEVTRHCRVFRLVDVFEPTSATWTSIWSGSNRHWRFKLI